MDVGFGVSIFEALSSDASWGRKDPLTSEQVADIRRLYGECGWPQTDIAKLFGVSQPYVSRIVNYERRQAMPIEVGQVYYAANPHNNNTRVKIVGEPTTRRGVWEVAVLAEDGSVSRSLSIKAGQFHTTVLNRHGNSRTNGYILEK